MGNRLEHVEVILNILMISYLALKNSGIKVIKVSEKLQQKELEKLVTHANSTKNLDSKKEFEAISRFVHGKSEEILMAFVLKTMEEAGLADLPKCVKINGSCAGTIMRGMASYLIQRPHLCSPSNLILLGLSIFYLVNLPHELGKYFWIFDLGKDLVMRVCDK